MVNSDFIFDTRPCEIDDLAVSSPQQGILIKVITEEEGQTVDEVDIKGEILPGVNSTSSMDNE